MFSVERCVQIVSLFLFPIWPFLSFRKEILFRSHEKSIILKVRKADCHFNVQALLFSISINQSISNFAD